ncbi:MAG: hypothetical protein JXB88_20625 [Spirochaetales bacterium]|nr:hypothetical protein [Spirochaetales bacterium]
MHYKSLKNIFYVKTILLCIPLLLTLVNCPFMNDPTNSPEPTREPIAEPTPDKPAPPPSTVTVLRDGIDFRVIWTDVSGVDSYQVYRKQGEGSFYALDGAEVFLPEYSDGSYPKDTTLQYAVKSISGSIYSELSKASPVSRICSGIMFPSPLKVWIPVRLR